MSMIQAVASTKTGQPTLPTYQSRIAKRLATRPFLFLFSVCLLRPAGKVINGRCWGKKEKHHTSAGNP